MVNYGTFKIKDAASTDRARKTHLFCSYEEHSRDMHWTKGADHVRTARKRTASGAIPSFIKVMKLNWAT